MKRVIYFGKSINQSSLESWTIKFQLE